MNVLSRGSRTPAGHRSTAVPAMDGALKPNDALEAAEEITREQAPDNLVRTDGCIRFSTSNRLCELDPGGSPRVRTLAEFPSEISCMAALGGQLAVGLEAGEVRVLGRGSGTVRIGRLADRPIRAPVAACFENEHTLLLALGSQENPASDWKRDLMEGNASGSVWRIDLSTGAARLLCDAMAFPYGLEVTSGGRVLVSESWRHRIVDISTGQPRAVVDDLPFHPARLASTSNGELLVCGFAPRRPLVEFIQGEKAFLQRMLAEVPERYWMAPALSSESSAFAPLQAGQIRQRGVLKTWAPTRSYGLVATMDSAGRFVCSVHSRAGGVRHGTTSAVEFGNSLVVACKGGGAIVRLPLERGGAR